MSDVRLISPLLENYSVGDDPITSHNGVSCYPALREGTDDRYIVKVISIPATSVQLDAFLISGVYPNRETALAYFNNLANGVIHEAEVLNHLAKLEGFLPLAGWQIVPTETFSGYEVYLLSTYKSSLKRTTRKNGITHLGAVNLALDLCAALATARNSGCIYVDLKPENVFLGDDGRFRIGDIGFVPISCLKYATLDDRYRSDYTAPELSDPLAPLSENMDVYALGRILHCIYNSGKFENAASTQELTPPAYADEELSAIIMKACAVNPEERWQTPTEMGQALVDYMQKNSVNDTPIIPVPEEELSADEENPVSEEAASDDTANPEQITSEEKEASDLLEEDAAFLELADNLEADENINLDDIISQADDVISHEVTPVNIVTEPIEIKVPEIVPEITPPSETEDSPITEKEETETVPKEKPARRSSASHKNKESGAWKKVVGWVAAAAILCGGLFYGYKTYYLQPVSSISVDVKATSATITLKTDIPSDQLQIVCSDTYGKSQTVDVVDHAAQISSLNPGTQYQAKAIIKGFHKIDGPSEINFGTPSATAIVGLSVVNGSEEGSAIVMFSVDGPESSGWTLHYTPTGGAEKTLPFTGHTVSVSGLELDKTYSFVLTSNDDLMLTGESSIEFTPKKLILAQNLQANVKDGVLNVSWQAPEGTEVSEWTVQCTDGKEYGQVLKTHTNEAQFGEIQQDSAYTVSVIAKDMTLATSITVNTNPLQCDNFRIEEISATEIRLAWDAPADTQWVVKYQVDELVASISTQENSAVIQNIIPGAVYNISLLNEAGEPASETLMARPERDGTFDAHGVSADDVIIYMCHTPDYEFSTYSEVPDYYFTTSYASGDKASYLMYASDGLYDSDDELTVVFSVRTKSHELVAYEGAKYTWNDMWDSYYYAVNLNCLPEAVGSYYMDIFFDGAYLNTIYFEITD